MKMLRAWSVILTCALFCMTFPRLPVLAGTDDSVSDYYEAVDGNQIPEERLNDSVIDYDELGTLIHLYNSDVRELTDSTERTRADYVQIRDTLEAESENAQRKKRAAKDNGETEDYAEYSGYQSVYQSAVKSYNDMLGKLDSYYNNKSRLSLEKQLTQSAQNLMISYWSASLQADYSEKTEELYQSIYEDTVTQQSAGLATGQDVLTAYNNWLSMSASSETASESAKEVYQSLCLLLGVDAEGSLAVGEIPAVEENFLAGRDREADVSKAIDNNADLISERTTDSGDTAATNRKNRTVEEYENKIRMKMDDLYEGILSAQIAYEAAKTGYSSAEITWNNARSKFDLGMLSRSEYLEEERNFLQKEANFKSAQLSLLQSVETYKWAVLGIMTLD
ncbi:MAG: TolC family protein [Clostridiales bacterium]|nr:TolC family protein [Clostridiales bacterium]